ncbi:DNA translocase FtsK [Modicisalibacter radicis]|uniref:DNA translocase FtsK n=1 Tax=Halomonas sp. EAR18 TaxID=2518972 RepID=UPI001FCE4A14|nr:DNA translocase FtsK [Halomonas sp. EAR18]
MSVDKKTPGRRETAAQARERARRIGVHLQGASREGVIILLLAGCVFLLLALFSYVPADPGWSQSGPEQGVDNWMGAVGAWLADVLYSLFGASALWWPGMLGFAAWRLMRRREVRVEWDATALAVRAAGLVLLLLATTSLGSLHFFNPASELPYKAGGILGEGLSEALQPLVGLRGATLLALAAFLCGFPLFSGLSWLSVMDELGLRAQRAWAWLGRQFGGTRARTKGADDASSDAASEPAEEPARSAAADGTPPWWRRWLGRGRGAGWQTEPALAGGQRLEPQLHEAPEKAPANARSAATAPGEPLRAERDRGTDIPWDVPERTPSAKRPEAAYSAQEARIREATTPRDAPGVGAAPRAAGNHAAGDGVSRRAPETVPEPILPDDDEPPIPTGVARPISAEPGDKAPDDERSGRSEGSGLAASVGDAPRDAAARADSVTAPAADAPAEDASSAGMMARQEPREIDWTAWNDDDADVGDDTREPRLSWDSAANGDVRHEPVEDGSAEVRRPAEPIEPARPDDDDEPAVPRVATAEQAQAAADDPQGPALWTVEHLQSQRPVMSNMPEPDGEFPSLRLLTPPDPQQPNYTPDQLADMAELLETRLREYGVKAEVVETWPGPVITRFEIKPAAGVKVSKISNLAKDLARSLMVKSVRVVEIIPGKPTVGIEIPNPNRAMIRLREVIDSDAYQQAASPLTLALGHDIGGAPVVANLGKMPHLLVAGTTGSGKSVGVNGMLISMLLKASPDDVRMIMVDPKMLELSVYDGIPHLLAPVVTDMKEAANGLRWCVAEMERRYKLMAAMGVRNIAGFNAKLDEAERAGAQVADPLWEPQPWQMHEQPPVLEKLPYIVVVIDEFADMFMIVGKKVEELIARLAQKARAAGIHLILATQRPSVDVVTGLIKANIPTRMAFQVSSKVDSRTILDQGGAEALLGHGDMLYLPAGAGMPTRVHGAFVDDDEVHRVVEDWKRRGEPEYIEEILTGGVNADALTGLEAESGGDGDAEQDALYDEAVMFVTESRRASISAVQRRFKIGYNRAARLVEAMEVARVVSSMGTNGSREVLAPPPAGD